LAGAPALGAGLGETTRGMGSRFRTSGFGKTSRSAGHPYRPLQPPGGVIAMTMSRYLLSRAIWICAACLCCALVVALWLAARAIGDERRGAHAMAQLIPRLSALQTAAPAEREAHLAALRTINASAQMRHLWLHLEDATGQVLVSEPQPRDSSPLGGLLALPGWGPDAARLESSWQIHTRDGATYHAALRWNPESEIREASGDMAGTLVVLVVYGALLLLGIHWALGQALAPLATDPGGYPGLRRQGLQCPPGAHAHARDGPAAPRAQPPGGYAGRNPG